jgi:hypothetical protein
MLHHYDLAPTLTKRSRSGNDNFVPRPNDPMTTTSRIKHSATLQTLDKSVRLRYAYFIIQWCLGVLPIARRA